MYAVLPGLLLLLLLLLLRLPSCHPLSVSLPVAPAPLPPLPKHGLVDGRSLQQEVGNKGCRNQSACGKDSDWAGSKRAARGDYLVWER